jgi:hypothetical protein
MQRTFDDWHQLDYGMGGDQLRNDRRRVWDEMQQLPDQLPRTRIIAVDPEY